ncbi:hypothetical protein RFI_12898 [Reticulomyxa filosa]|uniref:Uncharacterized protein n=1 Tax=Reticulomyxa filosa TaxID=46433 RepID=X6NEE0_RETFI|nr:hypothetical protein RFI_12898 [Reticulomyxa filosa]|eukprot:ETO24258.1 hypothetical protein RFI_12898 [Reticulomyxa filosa]
MAAQVVVIDECSNKSDTYYYGPHKCPQCDENKSKRDADESREKREIEDREKLEMETIDFLARKRQEEKELEKLQRLVREKELEQEEYIRKNKKKRGCEKKMRDAFSQPFGRTDEIYFEKVMFPLLQLNSTAPAAVYVWYKFNNDYFKLINEYCIL